MAKGKIWRAIPGVGLCTRLISRGREVKKKYTHNIWCTGKITIEEGRHPELHAVEKGAFPLKLNAFLSQTEALLFLVPAANIRKSERAMCRALQVEVLSIEQFRERLFQNIPITKIVLVGQA